MGSGLCFKPHPFLRRVDGLWLALGTGDGWTGQSLEHVMSVLETWRQRSLANSIGDKDGHQPLRGA